MYMLECNTDWLDAFSATTLQLQIPLIFAQGFKSQYFLFIRSSREAAHANCYGAFTENRATVIWRYFTFSSRAFLSVFNVDFSGAALLRPIHVSLVPDNNRRYLIRASWDALEIGSGRMIHFIYSASGTSEILLGSESNPLLRISRRVTGFSVIYRVSRRRWRNTMQTNSPRCNVSLV